MLRRLKLFDILVQFPVLKKGGKNIELNKHYTKLNTKGISCVRELMSLRSVRDFTQKS